MISELAFLRKFEIDDKCSRFCWRSSGGGRRDRRKSAWQRTSARTRSACRIIQGAPLQCCFAGRTPFGDKAADGGGADGQDCGRLIDCRLATVGGLALTIDGDVVLMPKGTNTPPCPAVSSPCRLAGSVEQRGDRLVWHLSRQGANQINNFNIGGPSRLAGAVALHSHARMVVALSVHDQLQAVADDVDDDDLGY